MEEHLLLWKHSFSWSKTWSYLFLLMTHRIIEQIKLKEPLDILSRQGYSQSCITSLSQDLKASKDHHSTIFLEQPVLVPNHPSLKYFSLSTAGISLDVSCDHCFLPFTVYWILFSNWLICNFKMSIEFPLSLLFWNSVLLSVSPQVPGWISGRPLPFLQCIHPSHQLRYSKLKGAFQVWAHKHWAE